MLFGGLLKRGFQKYWRLSRGFRLAAEACVLDEGGGVLLVKTAARPGWHLPGGSVTRGETLERALCRHLRADCGIETKERPQLFWIYAEQSQVPPQHTVLFIIHEWRQAGPSSLPDSTFFGLDALPAGMEPETVVRIRQALEGRTPCEVC